MGPRDSFISALKIGALCYSEAYENIYHTSDHDVHVVRILPSVLEEPQTPPS